VAAHSDGALFGSLPGAGQALVPRMMAAFGTRRERYQSAYEMQCYSGIAPITEASGNSLGPCPLCLPQASAPDISRIRGQFHPAIEVGPGLLPGSAEGEEPIAPRGGPLAGIQMAAHHPYDEEIYMQSLRRRGSLLAGTLGLPTLAWWKSVAGFQKLSEDNT